MNMDSYKVAVQLSLVNGMTGGLTAIIGQFNTLNKTITSTRSSVSQLERDLASLKKTAIIGGAMFGAGMAGLSMLSAPVEAAKAYEMAAARFKALNLGDTVNREADNFARGANKFAVSSTQMMDALSASIGMFGNMGLAKQMAPVIAQLNAANSAMFGGNAQSLDSASIQAIMRFNDMRGLTDSAADFSRGLDLAQRIYTGSGGAIKFTDLEQLAKRGGAAFKGLSDEGVMMLATVMQEQGGNATGTALMSMYQNLIAGRTTKKTMAALQAAGLATVGQVRSGEINGKPSYSTQITGIVDEELLRTNPGMWLMKYAEPAARKAGAKTDSEVIGFINNLLSNRTGSNMAATFTTQQLQAMRDLNLVKNAKGAQGTIDLYQGTTQGGIDNFNARMQDLKIALGQGVLPVLIKVVNGLTTFITKANEFATTYPKVTSGLMATFAILSGLVAAGGVVMLATASFKALGIALAFSKIGGAAGIAMSSAKLIEFGAALAVVAAGVAGYQFGDKVVNPWINKQIEQRTGVKGATLGTWLYDKMHGDDDAKLINGVAPKGKSQVAPHSHDIVVDGQKLGQTTAKHIAADAAKPASGGSRFDPRRAPFTPQATWANN